MTATVYPKQIIDDLIESLYNADFLAKDLIRLAEFNELESIKDILYKKSKIIKLDDLIDFNANPFTPDGLSVVEHTRRNYLWKWNPQKIKLHLSEGQGDESCIFGYNLKTELEVENLLNANVLDWLLAHPELIPEEYQKYSILFWGTIYKDFSGRPCVRFLAWNTETKKWFSSWELISSNFYNTSPAAVLLD